MTTNGQLIDTGGYHIKSTNSTCNMISCFRLKGPCLSMRAKNSLGHGRQILIIVKKCYQWKIFW